MIHESWHLYDTSVWFTAFISPSYSHSITVDQQESVWMAAVFKTK